MGQSKCDECVANRDIGAKLRFIFCYNADAV